MTREVDIRVHRTDQVSQGPTDTAVDELQLRATDFSEVQFNVTQGYTGLYNGGHTKDDWGSRKDSTKRTEDTLQYRNELGKADVHLVLFDKALDGDGFNGAGYCPYQAGVSGSEMGFGSREYTSEHGEYGLTFANTVTKNYPFNERIYRNTVSHETGHALGGEHSDGSVYRMNTGYHETTPMSTWYVEYHCGPHWGSGNRPSLCVDDSGQQEACYHVAEYSDCAQSDIQSSLENNYVGEYII